jgi:uncharacterized protein
MNTRLINPGKPSPFFPLLHVTLAILAGAGCGLQANELTQTGGRVKVEPVVPLRARAFPLQEVRLLDGPFQHAMELDRQYLLSLDPERLLHTFRLNAGLVSTAKPLGGWEEPKGELRGHFAGHYLTGCALMYAATGDERLKAKGEAVVRGMAECQARLGSGYLSAYPEEFIDRVEAQKPVWAPYYTLHKILAGLLDMYVYCGDAQALQVASKFGDWVVARNSRLTDVQMQKMLGNEHGGINEAMANLYALTGQRKYLEMALRLNHQDLVGPFSHRQDNLTGKHANTQIPKFIGTAREYELTGDEALKTASLFFWETVARERSYVIGGHSDGEMFTPKEKLSTAFGPSTTETCNTYNMLKLTRHLFAWDPRAEYADFYERALYNHILASQNPETGMMCYYVPLRTGSSKTYNDPLNSFWCCTGTGVENHAKYGDSIYFHEADKALYVNLFIASELDWKALGLKLRQETKFPDQAASKLIFTCAKPVTLDLRVRCPWWAENGLEMVVNGQGRGGLQKPGGYATVARTWQNGDVVELRMPFTLRTEGFKDNPRRLAFLNGPIVLGAPVDTKKPFPAVVAEPGRALASLQPITGKANTFAGPADIFRIPGQTGSQGVTFEPFYRMHGGRHYMVYFDSFTPEQWQGREKEYAAQVAREKELEARSVDFVLPNNPQNERDHNLQGERTGAGDFGDRKWRHAIEGGWFSWDVKVQADQPQELWVTYWGSDGNNRVFDLLVDGQKLATQRLERNKPDQFFDEVYRIPVDLTRGRDKVTIRFQARPGAWAGGVFGLRVMKPAK